MTRTGYLALVGVLSLAGCAGWLRGEGGNEEPRALCHLADGHIEAWSGLGRIQRNDLPACLGAVVREETRRYHLAYLASDVFRPGWGEVRVGWYRSGGTVELVEVTPTQPPDAAAFFADLPTAERVEAYSAYEREVAGLVAPPGQRIEEAVFAARGLALVVERDADGTARLLRLRAFTPMPVDRYVQDYVHVEPEPIE